MSTVTEQLIGPDNISYMRQEGWFNPLEHPNSAVTMVGCGGIGSPTALALGKLGIRTLALIDPDVVERHNVPNQLFHIGKVGDKKVENLAAVLSMLTPAEVEAYDTEFLEQPKEVFNNTVVVSALDSMEARISLWNERIKHNVRVPLFIDARLGGQVIRVFSIKPTDPSHVQYYEDTLHTDEEAQENVCTMQSIIDVGFVVASLITRSVRLHYSTSGSPEREVFFDQGNLMIMKEA